MRYLIYTALALIAAVSCRGLEQDVELNLPEVEKELMVECYLEPGKPYRLLLTETKSYFESLSACPFVRDATVVVVHNGKRDTLNEAFYFNNDCNPEQFYGIIPFLSEDSTRFYNYASTTICPEDYSSDFKLEVSDSLGRKITATTRLLERPRISSFEYSEPNNENKFYLLLGTEDNPATLDYYRVMIHRRSLTKRDSATGALFSKEPRVDVVADDEALFSENELIIGTGYDFKQKDTVIASVYHIEEAYYKYLNSSANAQSANGNPFGQPSAVTSNIEGGRGVFTMLAFSRDTLILPKIK